MAKLITPLSATQVNKSKPKNKEYSLGDGNGLLLRIKPNGTKSWIFNYVHPTTKKRKNIGLGIYPDITLASARVKQGKLETVRRVCQRLNDVMTYVVNCGIVASNPITNIKSAFSV